MTQPTLETKLKEICQNWFYTQPLFFTALCSHTLIANSKMNVAMRCGKRLIEYSPKLLENAKNEELTALLTVQVCRILLQHPYKRQPYNANKKVLQIASDLVIYRLLQKDKSPLLPYLSLPGLEYLKVQAVRFHTLTFPLGEKWAGSEEEKFFQKNLFLDHKTNQLIIEDDLSYEEWYKKILFLIKETSGPGPNALLFSDFENLSQELCELWEENQEEQAEIAQYIEDAEVDMGWGGLGENLQREIKQGADFSFDYRRALTKFRQNVVSAKRKLTRMRPSRRYGFKAMGSLYERKANILIALDVSGSITDESFDHFSHAVKNFFFLGLIEKIDLIFFDVNLKNTTPLKFDRKVNFDQIKGKGGTNFQPAIDFYSQNSKEYSGMIIFTDGEGAAPCIEAACKNILWILDSRTAYEKHKSWINSLQGSSATFLPF